MIKLLQENKLEVLSYGFSAYILNLSVVDLEVSHVRECVIYIVKYLSMILSMSCHAPENLKETM